MDDKRHLAVGCYFNRVSIRESDMCGCWTCIRIFLPGVIRIWIHEGRTALCPYCSNPSVLANAVATVSVESLTERFEASQADFSEWEGE